MSEARVRTPRPVTDRRDLRGLSLSPTDGFVLSRIDGTLNERDLVSATGLPSDTVVASLTTLEALGIITYANGPPAPAESGPAPAAGGPPDPRTSSVGLRAAAPPRGSDPDIARPPSPTRTTSSPAQAALSPEDLAALTEQVDLDEDTRRLVLATHRRLDRVDHYALLNVERTADRKNVKRAYYELAGRFHPDKYFRKNLGTFKARMEAIFARVTLAHDTLSDREKRAEYDVYLAERRLSRTAEEQAADALEELRRVEQEVERKVQAEATMPGAPSVPSVPAVAPPATPVPQVDLSARRDALARRLLGGRSSISTPVPGRGAPPAPPASPSTPSAAEAMEVLRRRYEDRVSRAKASEARKYVANAQVAEAAGDPIAAANAYRVAVQLAPADAEIARAAAAANAKAEIVLGETYARQAAYEERNAQWREASRSWSRVCKARPHDGPSHERAAHALLMAGDDLHEAERLAKRACEVDPSAAANRVTLAKVYQAAGLPMAAKRELETAAQLSPQDDTIRSMLKKL